MNIDGNTHFDCPKIKGFFVSPNLALPSSYQSINLSDYICTHSNLQALIFGCFSGVLPSSAHEKKDKKHPTEVVHLLRTSTGTFVQEQEGFKRTAAEAKLYDGSTVLVYDGADLWFNIQNDEFINFLMNSSIFFVNF